ncbi:hypothetical protein KQH56_02915 [bacterium]|nr:hypothetical protein [bacterium]
MMRRNTYRITAFLILLLSLALSACAAPSPAANIPVSTIPASTTTTNPSPSQETPIPSSTCAPTLTPETTETPSTRTSYGMEISLDYAEHTLKTTQIIDYTNTTGADLSQLPLIVPPAVHESVFALLNLQLPPEYAQSNYQMEGAQINLNLVPELQADGRIEIILMYRLALPQARSVFGYTDRQLTLADWFPFIPPYIASEGWLVNDPGQVGEYLAYPLADFNVNLRLSPSMEGLVVAASAPASSHEGNCWRYQAGDVRNIVFALSPEYQMTTAQNDSVTIQAYTFPEHSHLAQRTADLARSAWSRYEAIYGPNSRTYMSIIEGDLDDGMEYDGAYFISDWYYNTADETPKNYYTLLTVHETAHQWFYAQVHNDPASEPWLDESLATYTELLYLESAHPDLVDWWWDFRVADFNPSGYVDSTIYDHHKFRPYVNAVYLRGVQFLQDLRDAIGEDGFFAFLGVYAAPDPEDTLRTAEDFFILLDEHSDVDLTNLLQIYFRSAQP